MPEETAIEDIVEMRSGISRVFEEMTEARKTVAGIHVSPEASLNLKSDKPSQPSDRQKRITVG